MEAFIGQVHSKGKKFKSASINFYGFTFKLVDWDNDYCDSTLIEEARRIARQKIRKLYKMLKNREMKP